MYSTEKCTDFSYHIPQFHYSHLTGEGVWHINVMFPPPPSLYGQSFTFIAQFVDLPWLKRCIEVSQPQAPIVIRTQAIHVVVVMGYHYRLITRCTKHTDQLQGAQEGLTKETEHRPLGERLIHIVSHLVVIVTSFEVSALFLITFQRLQIPPTSHQRPDWATGSGDTL